MNKENLLLDIIGNRLAKVKLEVIISKSFNLSDAEIKVNVLEKIISDYKLAKELPYTSENLLLDIMQSQYDMFVQLVKDVPHGSYTYNKINPVNRFIKSILDEYKDTIDA